MAVLGGEHRVGLSRLQRQALDDVHRNAFSRIRGFEARGGCRPRDLRRKVQRRGIGRGGITWSQVIVAPMGDRQSRGARLAWSTRMVWEASRQARFPFVSDAAVREAQQRRIRATVAYAYTHVPYYREAMRRLLLGPEDIRSVSDLTRLPLLEREQLQRDPEYFRSEQWPAAACVLLQSGGTTGAPLTVFRDPPSLLLEAAQRERQRSLVTRLAGRRMRYREAAISPHDSSVSTAISAVRATSLVPTSLRVQRHHFSMLRAPVELVRESTGTAPR